MQKPDNRLRRAIARGDAVRRKLTTAEGGSLSAAEAAHELGISEHAILGRYQKGQLIAWQNPQNVVRFPVWQFRDRKVLDGLKETLKALNTGNRLDDFGRILSSFPITVPSTANALWIICGKHRRRR